MFPSTHVELKSLPAYQSLYSHGGIINHVGRTTPSSISSNNISYSNTNSSVLSALASPLAPANILQHHQQLQQQQQQQQQHHGLPLISSLTPGGRQILSNPNSPGSAPPPSSAVAPPPSSTAPVTVVNQSAAPHAISPAPEGPPTAASGRLSLETMLMKQDHEMYAPSPPKAVPVVPTELTSGENCGEGGAECVQLTAAPVGK